MRVTIKVLCNGKEIEAAKQENQKRANQRVQEGQKAKKDRVEILDLEVPKEDLKEVPKDFNGFDIVWATISQNDMIFIKTDTEAFECLRDTEVEKKISEIIELKELAKKKELESK